MATPSQTKITLATLLHDMAIYNQWANQTLVDWLRQKPSELMQREVASSFPGMKVTLEHIWDTQRFWHCVLQEIPAPESFRFKPFEGTVEDVFDALTQQSEEMTTYITSLDDAALSEIVSFTTPWVSGSQPRADFINHAFFHSTYHRGQLTSIGRQLGFTDAPMTDYNFYILMVKGK